MNSRTTRQFRELLAALPRHVRQQARDGDLRVYYEIAEEPEAVVTILAVGVKDRNRVLIGGKEIQL
jgi:hypothetical protein